MTLADFLLARIAEDEAAAKVATPGPWRESMDVEDFTIAVDGYPADPMIVRAPEPDDIAHIARHDPARVLAECEAKRRIVDWAAPYSGDIVRVPTDRPGVYNTKATRYMTEDGEDVLRLLALPYAGHPDYREEWKP